MLLGTGGTAAASTLLSTDTSAMAPPRAPKLSPIRTSSGCGLQGVPQCTSLQPRKRSWRAWLGVKAQEQQQNEQQEDSQGQDEDLVCLSPLSQFFCNVNNPPDIYANMTLEGHCSLEELVAPMQHMADLHDRFRRRLVFRFGTWHGEVLQHFCVRSLMREVTLEGSDAQQAYHTFMGKLMSEQPLGSDGLPPWDVFCIHYTCDPGRTDVLMRASHIIGDGQLFMKLIKQIMEPLDATARADFANSILNAPPGTLGVAPQLRRRRQQQRHTPIASDAAAAAADCDGSPAARRLAPRRSSSSDEEGSSGGSSSDLADASSSGSDGGSSMTCSGSGGGLRCVVSGLQQQHHQQQQQLQQQRRRRGSMPKWLRAIGSFFAFLFAQWTALIFSAFMLFGPADPVTCVKASPAQCSGPRSWGSLTLSLPEFHRAAKALGVSLNTLAVACLAGGLRRYLLRSGGPPPARRVRLCGMVDTRSMPGLARLGGGDSGAASNNFSFIGVPLFTGEAAPLARLARVGAALSWVRHSLVVPIALQMPHIIQCVFPTPAWSSWAILRAMPAKTTVGFSNMRGPCGSWALAGYRVTRIHNGVQPMAFGSFVSLFSYDRGLTFTHTCFETKTTAPELLLECMLEEYRVLRKAAAIATTDGCCGDDPGSPTDVVKIKAA